MNYLADFSSVVTSYVSDVHFLNSETSAAMVGAELYLFFGGLLFAFAFGTLQMVFRATKGAGYDVDL